MKRLLFTIALFATPALAQDVTIPVATSTAKTAGADCKAQAVQDYRSAWQQDTGRPYLANDDSILVQWSVVAAARGCEFRKTAAPVANVTVTYGEGFRAGAALVAKAATDAAAKAAAEVRQ